eukprot:11203755-Lingulodinium_polyedra.AAC.1
MFQARDIVAVGRSHQVRWAAGAWRARRAGALLHRAQPRQVHARAFASARVISRWQCPVAVRAQRESADVSRARVR